MNNIKQTLDIGHFTFEHENRVIAELKPQEDKPVRNIDSVY